MNLWLTYAAYALQKFVVMFVLAVVIAIVFSARRLFTAPHPFVV
ncbi:MAG TPA: hypothetical protein VGI35_11600 [Steroidobacteraceae bacterium]